MSIVNIESLKPAPRRVPLLLQLQVLFGGEMNQVIWSIFFGFIIFAWIFAPSYDWRSLGYINANLVYEQGDVYDSNAWFRFQNTNDSKPIAYANYYKFGGIYEGISYSKSPLPVGEKVTIVHPQGNPKLSRIEGMMNAPYELYSFNVFYFITAMVIGFFFIFGSIKRGIKSIKLLKNGNSSYGKLESVNETNAAIGKKTIYKLIFGYMGKDGLSHKAIAITEQPEVLQDEEMERILVNIHKPDEAILVDILPGDIRVDDSGNIKPTSTSYPIVVALVPLTVITLNLYCLCWFIWLYINY